jgi:hypothetical protein
VRDADGADRSKRVTLHDERPQWPSDEPGAGFTTEMRAWRELVGRAILAFGEIEVISYRLLVGLPSERIFESVAHLPFARRVNLILQLLAAKPGKGRPELVKLLKEAKRLAETRNLVAHNPMAVGVYRDEAKDGFFLRSEVRHFLKERGPVLDRAAMDQFTRKVEELRGRMGFVAFLVLHPNAKKRPQGAPTF